MKIKIETKEEIKAKVAKGVKVYASNDNYLVILDSIGQYLIHSQCNDHYIGLHGREGTKYENQLNGNNFYYYA